MKFTLTDRNVFEYLAKLGYCQLEDAATTRIQRLGGKNFNLLLRFADGKSLLVKQEPLDRDGTSAGELTVEWQIHQIVTDFPSLGAKLARFLPELLHSDRENSIAIVKFLDNYANLWEFYAEERVFPLEIAAAVGDLFGNIHAETYKSQDYLNYLVERDIATPEVRFSSQAGRESVGTISRLRRLEPAIFGCVSLEAMRFFKYYQKFPELQSALIQIADRLQPCCLTHNDLKLNNLLVSIDWQQPESTLIKAIDWEKFGWGDPLFDLGSLLANYLDFWLDGVIFSRSLDLTESLQLATTPLELIRPSLHTLIDSYVAAFPAVVEFRRDYLDWIVSFAGLALLQRVEIDIQSSRTFTNSSLVMMQVAKQSICAPTVAKRTIFGS
jgi:5'-deoxynucleotidase YfbR-like HD superfamily hydrolase